MSIIIQPDPAPLRVDETGTIRVGDTRITLDVLLNYLFHGVQPEQLVSQEWYPALSLADIHGTLAYYYRHQAEVDNYLAQRRDEADKRQAEIEAKHSSFDEVKDRLLAKRDGKID